MGGKEADDGPEEEEGPHEEEGEEEEEEGEGEKLFARFFFKFFLANAFRRGRRGIRR